MKQIEDWVAWRGRGMPGVQRLKGGLSRQEKARAVPQIRRILADVAAGRTDLGLCGPEMLVLMDGGLQVYAWPEFPALVSIYLACGGRAEDLDSLADGAPGAWMPPEMRAEAEMLWRMLANGSYPEIFQSDGAYIRTDGKIFVALRPLRPLPAREWQGAYSQAWEPCAGVAPWESCGGIPRCSAQRQVVSAQALRSVARALPRGARSLRWDGLAWAWEFQGDRGAVPFPARPELPMCLAAGYFRALVRALRAPCKVVAIASAGLAHPMAWEWDARHWSVSVLVMGYDERGVS